MEMQERYVEKFFNYLAEGKIMGQKCADCGTYRLLPVPVCEECQGTNLSWVELGKTGKLLHFAISVMPHPRFGQLTPFGYGAVQLEEGPVLFTLIDGIDVKNPAKEFDRLPLDVDIVIKELVSNYVPIAQVR